MKTVLIDASNLHHGGGVQVASSLIYELSKNTPEDFYLMVYASEKVNHSLPIDFDKLNFKSYVVENRFGLKSCKTTLSKASENSYITLTIFGPQYSNLKSKIKITGFAQPWIAYPNNDMNKQLGIFEWLKLKSKFFLQRKIFFRDDVLVVEHDSVAKSLLANYRKLPRVCVIENTVSAPFFNPAIQNELNIPEIKSEFVVGFLGRNYPHKNLKIFKEINNILKFHYKVDIAFLFSLDEREMSDLGFHSLSNFYTCGPISNPQCPSFYQSIDLFVFPTLLECFSVAPLEALISGVDVLASNRKFISEVYGDMVNYFEPLDPFDISEKIVLSMNNQQRKKVEYNCNYTAKDRAIKYCDLIREYL